MDNTDGKWEMQNSKALMEVLFSSIPDLILFKDGEGRWVFASDYALQLLGLSPDTYVGKTSAELSRITTKSEYREILLSRERAEERAWHSRDMTRSEVEFPLVNGRAVVLDVMICPIFNEDGNRRALVVIGRDITERIIAEERAYQLAYYDQLTKLPNRFMFEKELENYLVISNVLNQSCILMYLNIDRFKHINNSLGPAVGDQLLIGIANRLSQCVQEDSFLAHIGGDKFAILIPNVIGVEAKMHGLSQHMIACIKEPFHISHYELFMTATIGICQFPQDGEDAQTLMRHADNALNLAKETGNNCYQIYNEKMDIAAFKIFSLENSLKRAMSMEQFEIFYQPKVESVSHRIVGAEALIRWNHPEWGLTSPKEFIPLAEETGLIIPMGRWALQTVSRQLRAWQDAGVEIVPISVNVSAKQLMQRDFMNDIKHFLDEAGLPPDLIEIEITETSLIDNEDIIIEVIKQIRAYGLSVAIDDFGTGYSVLSYLKQFIADTIKIDRSFIQEIHTNDKASVIVKGIIQMVRNLNINVVAEGVETKEQMHLLEQEQCDQVQGYLFSQPINAEEFSHLLRKGHIELAEHQQRRKTDFNNGRKNFRVHLSYPLLAQMTIINFLGKDIKLGITEVLLWDIGLGGICFASNIKMAVRPDMTLSVSTIILGEEMNFTGRIVWSYEMDDDTNRYGLEFLINEDERHSLARLLNVFAAKLHQNPILPDCPFVATGVHRFFKRKSG